jgi:glycosyltransferase involved in cell wall biosynthesis
MKQIWVFHHYATPPSRSGLTRPYNFATHLPQDHYQTTVFTASYLHFSDQNLITVRAPYWTEAVDGVTFVYVRTPSSAAGILARVLNMLAFTWRVQQVARRYARLTGTRPDLIYASSPHPLALVAGIRSARSFKTRCLCEVRDLWPETIFANGKTSAKSLLGRLLTAGEHWIYKRADALVFTKEGDTDYLREQQWTTTQGGDVDLAKCHYINNGVDLAAFDRLAETEVLVDPDLDRDTFKVVYAGAIRPINHVDNLLDAAALLKDHPDIQFLIFGGGNQLQTLRERVAAEKLDAVHLKGYVNKRMIPSVLRRASVNVLNYAQDRYNWSRGNSSNKLFEYMASGKPILSTVQMNYSPIDQYQCGLSLASDTPQALAAAILELHDLPAEALRAFCERARAGARDFDYPILADKLRAVIDPLID